MSSISRPDLSARPLQMTCEYTVNARPEEVYAAWTKRFDTWFAQGGHTSSTTGMTGADILTMADSSMQKKASSSK